MTVVFVFAFFDEAHDEASSDGKDHDINDNKDDGSDNEDTEHNHDDGKPLR